MFLLGVIDMIVLPFNSIFSGIQCMLGYHYCNNPSLHFIIGTIPTCDTPIVYLILNQPLRKAVFKLIRDLAGKPAGNPANLVGNASMFTVAITRSIYQDITMNQGSVNLNPINSQDIATKQDSVNFNPINSHDITTNHGSVDRNPINSQDLRMEDEQHHN
uniref:G-protein coupled receptors family 1 profile domain-containing protein n=1 Tax=Acrobeloides nanus TaxID=290746 RepID=A0A914CCC4_9BILA